MRMAYYHFMRRKFTSIFKKSLIYHFGRIVFSDPDHKYIRKSILRTPDPRQNLSISEFVRTFGIANTKTVIS